MQCTNPIKLFKKELEARFPDGLLVPCNKCLACRIQKRKEWSMRLLHELAHWDKSVFVTLTYTKENTPPNGSLVKKDLQKFIKRLRKSLDSYDGRKIRYFACGEYGEKSRMLPNGIVTMGERPHYHLIIFGLSIFEQQFVVRNWSYCDWSNDKILRGSFGLAEALSIEYVAGYIHGKLSGSEAEKEYDNKGRESVFRLMSKGIGRDYVVNNSEQLVDQKGSSVRGHMRSLPRYYLDKLDMSDEDKALFLISIKADSQKRSMELVEFFTDISGLTEDVAYKVLPNNGASYLATKVNEAKKQHDKNLNAKINLYQKKL